MPKSNILIKIKNGQIAIGQRPLILLLDGTNRNRFYHSLVNELYEYFSDLVIETPRITFLSFPRVFNKVPSDDELESFDLASRGRFITPLYEAEFLKIARKKFNLVCLPCGKIYDWQDYSKELESIFNRCFIFETNKDTGTYSGALTYNLDNMPLNEVRQLIKKELFNVEILSVALESNSGIPYKLSSGFGYKAEKNGYFQAANNEPMESLKMELKSVGPYDYASFILKIQYRENGKTRTVRKTFKNRNSSPAETDFIYLEKKNADIFNKAIAAYIINKDEHFCPSCNKIHRFVKPFFCSNGSLKDKFFNEGFIFKNILDGKDKKTAIFMVSKNGNVSYCLPEKNSGAWLKNKMIFTDKNGKAIMVGINGSILKVSVFKKIKEGLCVDKESGLYMLSQELS